MIGKVQVLTDIGDWEGLGCYLLKILYGTKLCSPRVPFPISRKSKDRGRLVFYFKIKSIILPKSAIIFCQILLVFYTINLLLTPGVQCFAGYFSA